MPANTASIVQLMDQGGRLLGLIEKYIHKAVVAIASGSTDGK